MLTNPSTLLIRNASVSLQPSLGPIVQRLLPLKCTLLLKSRGRVASVTLLNLYIGSFHLMKQSPVITTQQRRAYVSRGTSHARSFLYEVQVGHPVATEYYRFEENQTKGLRNLHSPTGNSLN
jgi:hypothetical protein